MIFGDTCTCINMLNQQTNDISLGINHYWNPSNHFVPDCIVFFPLYLLISSFKCKHLEIWGNFRICFHFLLFPFLLPPPPIIDKNATYINWTCTCMTVLIKGEALLTIGYTNFSHVTTVLIAKYLFTGSVEILNKI